jgi:hypothetical protein
MPLDDRMIRFSLLCLRQNIKKTSKQDCILNYTIHLQL